MITGYYLSIGAPNSTRIATTLRQAIWKKNDVRWPVAGIPDIFYSDHGADFTSTHIEQIAADLGMQLVNTIVYKPRGRGKIERFFRTVVQMFCPDHNTKRDKPKALTQIENAFREWLDSYHHRKHKEIKMSPVERWTAAGFLPRLPESLDSLDLMLLKVSKPRTMTGVGIRFDGRRYSHEVLTESNGERFGIRYDPRDTSHIWVYGEGGKLVCKAECKGLNPTKEEAAETISNRQRVKKRLKKDVKAKQIKGDEFLSEPEQEEPVTEKIDDKQPRRRLRRHFHERN